MTTEKDDALAALAARKAVNEPRVIDNASLPAGSDMYYYCRGCKALVSVKPEGWWRDPPPPRFCGDCKPLADKGWIA